MAPETSQKIVTLKELLARMQEEKNFPAVSRHISEINAKASPNSNSSAHQLAELVLKDYALTSKLLRVANSALFGQFSGQISTISRAVVVLGFEQVRLAATGLIFFEHLQDKARSHYLKEAVLASFLSGILARELARHLRLEGGERYFIGAMFHGFGRLLAMYYFPQEYEVFQELTRAGEGSEEKASRRALGISFTELGIGVARSWGLPEIIIGSMKKPRPEDLEKKTGKADHHQCLSGLANELCALTMNLPVQERPARLQELLKRYKELYPVPQKKILEMLDGALSEMEKFSDVLSLNRADLALLNKRKFAGDEEEGRAAAEPELVEAPAASALKKFQVREPAQRIHRDADPEDRRQHLMAGIQEITNVMLDDFALDQILNMILETVYLGIGFDRVLLFIKDPRSGAMLARFGLGKNTRELVKGFSFPVDEGGSDLFSWVLAEGRDLYVGNISDTAVRDHKPRWFRDAIFSPSFALYPITVDKKCIGLIYGGHDQPGEHLDTQQLNSMKTLRNQAALAIKQCYAG
ncbi:hypothetical protein DESUT3_13190 [Desulfuromonas versatilis]|uniref:HDOD domain-containing protein n=1 Tax=Desulfuromonas versatilis TaxID=2802975 RepID=A0ABN6DVS1_9BACT|nr:HDOD domain-containing protein [Desulfuromonas versatilis]BCR04250.1 hypothetical protein DESUT3_13190 [Desulfuromonas versatilis]